MNAVYTYMFLALVLITASQALAQTPIIILPSILDSRLLANYSQASDTSKACSLATITAGKIWPPPIDDIAYFFATLNPVPACWWHLMRLKDAADGTFTSNAGVSMSTSLSLGTSFVLGPLGAAIRTATGYNNSMITVLSYDWRMDMKSLEKSGAVTQMANRISALSRRFKEKAVIVAYSNGNAVALKLLQISAVQRSVKGYIALAPPFGGSVSSIATLSSGSVEGVLPPVLLDKLQLPQGVAFTREQLLYNASFGMSGFVSLSPSAAGFPGDPVIVTAGTVKYKVSQLPDLYTAIGQDQLAKAYQSAQQVATAPLPSSIATYCIYGNATLTASSLTYKKAFEGAKLAEVPTLTNLVPGDSVVTAASLGLCDKLTTPERVTRLPRGVNHFNTFSHPLGRAAVIKALKELIN